MSIALDSTSDNSGAIEVGGVQRIILGADGGAELNQSPTQESPPKHIATMEALWAYGGMPRFTPYVWGGKASAMPAGDTQSSGQQLLDLMYPDMRADVVATQFTCTETEWQADPYKRVTHWSLGDGVSWMRPPDKNGVQPGNVGAFYGTGTNPAGAKTGTAVTDAMRSITATFEAISSTAPTGAITVVASSNGSFPTDSSHRKTLKFDVSTQVPVADQFMPKTWYGIWMIRMYGRVLNTGTLDAAGLNARMDMLDARVSALEGGSSSLTKNGYKIHHDGEIEQWGVLEGVQVVNTVLAVTFPIPFPNQVFNPLITFAIASVVEGNTAPEVVKGSLSLTGMQVVGDGNAASSSTLGDVYWRVKGK